MKNESIKEIMKATPETKGVSLVKQIYTDNPAYKKTRNLVEDKFGITVKTANDIGRVTTLDFLEKNVPDKDEVLQLGVSVKAITKSSQKVLGIADLF